MREINRGTDYYIVIIMDFNTVQCFEYIHRPSLLKKVDSKLP